MVNRGLDGLHGAWTHIRDFAARSAKRMVRIHVVGLFLIKYCDLHMKQRNIPSLESWSYSRLALLGTYRTGSEGLFSY